MEKLKNKNSNGITLIALIITIIVMIILVGVTITVALNGGLFNTAQSAATNTMVEAEREQLLSAVVTAYDTETGTISKAKLEANLGTGWSLAEGDTAPYTVTSPKGNKFTVSADGTIEYTGKGGGQTPGGDTPTPPSGDDVPSSYTETIADLPETVGVIKYKDLETIANSDIKTAVDAGKIKAVLKETVDGTTYIAPIPTGFEVSTKSGENTISGGLVIKEGANEYVFMPCTEENYTEDSFGPLTGTYSKSNAEYDSQATLDYLYGTDSNGNSYYNYANDFKYDQDKTAIETSINKYKGFYVGRYETTINNGTIGSQKGATVLTARTTVKEGTNPNNNESYYYRWYGLYKAQKDLYSTSTSVFSSMITSKEWDTIMTFTGYGDTTRATSTYTNTNGPDLSGSAYKGTTDTYDLTKNIYDLAGNVREWTLKAYDINRRVVRGGNCLNSDSASDTYFDNPFNVSSYYGSRLALYIK